MKFRTFLSFVGPSVFLMLLFIAAPLVSVFIGSFQLTQPVVQQVEEEVCTAGFLAQTCTTEIRTIPILDENGDVVSTTEWVGWLSYARVLEPNAPGRRCATSTTAR